MKRICLILICIASIFLAEAQSSKETTTEYFDKSWKKTTDPTVARYYRTVESTDTNFIVRDYFISGKIQMIVYCSSVNPKLIKNGKSQLFYENGVLQEESLFKNDDRVGICKLYYESGQQRLEQFYSDKKMLYLHYYSEDGKELLNNGKGLITANGGDHNISYTEVEDSVAIASFYIQDKTMDTIYNVIEKPADYRGGFEKMMKDLKSVITYPKNARKNGIMGTVFVQFIVDKKGKVRDCKVIKGIDPDCDGEAMRGAAQLHGWNPGVHKGKVVNVAFVLPVKFKL